MARAVIENRLGVQAPPEFIWDAFADLDAWKDWNPLYTSASGKLGFGATLELTLAIPGQSPRTIRPVVESWTPNELIHWRLKELNGLVKTIRYIEIEKLTDTGCIFSNGEIFEGMLGPFVAKRMGRSIRAGFRAMGEAVKTRAEAAWQAQQNATT